MVARYYLFFIAFSFIGSRAWAQEQEETPTDTATVVVSDTIPVGRGVVGPTEPGTANPADTVLIEMVADEHSPRRAALLSAALPGLGQAYNRKYWKIPIIYGGFMFFGYNIIIINDRYQLFRRAAIALQADASNENPLQAVPGGSNSTRVALFRDRFRRNRDYNIILAAGWYGLNIIDAIVDAHLIEFDVNPNLAFNVRPASGSQIIHDAVPSLPYRGLALVLTLK